MFDDFEATHVGHEGLVSAQARMIGMIVPFAYCQECDDITIGAEINEDRIPTVKALGRMAVLAKAYIIEHGDMERRNWAFRMGNPLSSPVRSEKS